MVDGSSARAGAGRGAVRFLFDYISPNAYIAWTRIHDLARRADRFVEPVPTLFAGLLQAHGLQGPAEVPAKWRWMLRDILRKSTALGIDLVSPESHPFNPLLALRISSLDLDPESRRRLIDALFRAVWAGGPGVRESDVVAGIVSSVGLDGSALVAEAGTAQAKDRLRRATEQAIEAGVFGVPTVLVDGELFWGFDDFVHLERFLEGRDTIDEQRLAQWSEVRPSATRPR